MGKLEVKHLKREDGMDYWEAKGTLSTGKPVDCVLWTEVDGRDGGFEDEENVDIEVGGEEWDEIISSEEMNKAFETMDEGEEGHHFAPREGDDVTIKPLGDGKWRVDGVLGDASGPATLAGVATTDEGGGMEFVQDDGSEVDEDVHQELVEMIGELDEEWAASLE